MLNTPIPIFLDLCKPQHRGPSFLFRQDWQGEPWTTCSNKRILIQIAELLNTEATTIDSKSYLAPVLWGKWGALRKMIKITQCAILLCRQDIKKKKKQEQKRGKYIKKIYRILTGARRTALWESTLQKNSWSPLSMCVGVDVLKKR